MDTRTRERMFEPFFTTKGRSKGTGLGLATVYAIVQQSGGTLEVSSAPGRGTSVTVSLPCSEAAPHPDPTPTPNPEPTVSGPTSTVLVVEDEESVRALMRDVLEDNGHRTYEAADGDSALRVFEALDAKIDLLVTDVVMPGMSGPQLVGRLTRRHPGLKVLYVSGYHDDDALGQGIDVTGAAFLPKPFTPRTLLAEVRAVLEGPEPS